MKGLILSLFPGIGLLDMAFEQQGFCVVRGPDLIWGGDIHGFHPPAGRFEGIIGGPSCKRFSALANINRARYGEDSLAPNLIPEFERVVCEARPEWFLMENVEAAPLPAIEAYGITNLLLNNRWLGEKQNRLRRFSFGCLGRSVRLHVETVALEVVDYEPAVTGNNGGRRAKIVLDKNGRSRGKQGVADWQRLQRRSLETLCSLQGLPPDHLARAPFTVSGAREAIGQGVPLPMGRAVAAAVVRALAVAAEGKAA